MTDPRWELAQKLQKTGWMMATAESCTGGLIAGACTDLSGSSAWFERGFVAYSNAAKTELLGVDAALIETHGNGIDDLVSIGFFDGKIRCVRFCAEMNIGTLVRTGVREFWPVETADAGIVAHCILHDRNDVAPVLTRPGIHVHWREIVRAGADDFE